MDLIQSLTIWKNVYEISQLISHIDLRANDANKPRNRSFVSVKMVKDIRPWEELISLIYY